MNPTVVGFALNLLGQLPGLIKAGVDVIELVEAGVGKMKAFALEKREPTTAEWDELNAKIAALRGRLHAP